MGLVTRGIRTGAATLTASVALVVPFAAEAHAPAATSAPGHHDHGTVPGSRVADAGTPAPAAPAARALPRLRGQVGPGTTISVSRSRVVKGRYQVRVRDDSTVHNWHLSGPGGVSRRTSISGTGEWAWKVRLRPGTYTIVCDAHPLTMRTKLRVTAD